MNRQCGNGECNKPEKPSGHTLSVKFLNYLDEAVHAFRQVWHWYNPSPQGGSFPQSAERGNAVV